VSFKNIVLLLFSAGVGRSGTLIAMDKLLNDAAESQTIDILKCIEGLRLQRMYMVQTLVGYHWQFVFKYILITCHLCVLVGVVTVVVTVVVSCWVYPACSTAF